MKNTKKVAVNAVVQDMLTRDERERLLSLDAECRESRAYESFIDDLDCSAKMKRILRELAGKTAAIGGKVVRIGKVALDFTIKVLGEVRRRFPNVICSILVVLILKALISAIPFIGPYIAVLLEPLFVVVIVGLGVAKDVYEMIKPHAEVHFRVSEAAAQ